MNKIAKLRSEILKLLASKTENEELLARINLEFPKVKEHGCLATNAAMVLARDLKQNPVKLAEEFKEIFLKNFQSIEKIEIAGPGFINLIFKNEFWQEALKEIFLEKETYGKNNIGGNKKTNIEYGSPNPTGPLHIGHTRGAIFGDVLANIMEFSGFDVTRENYINDAGNQINTLAESLFLRYKEFAEKRKIEIPKGLYPGEYLIESAQKIFKESGDKFLNDKNYIDFFKERAVKEMFQLITQGFKALNIKHDVNFSEKSLHDKGKIIEVVKKLEKSNKLYMGVLPKPKGVDSEDWEAEEQLLFKATEFGDDVDRVVQKASGDYTYFAADAAYHQDKLERGFNNMILILGADHGGYIKRMKALVNALSDGKAKIDLKLCQLVKLFKNGKAFKMSKRDGTFITAEDLVNEIGIDALRFIMLSRKNDMSLDLDIDKAIEESKDNPIFYVQYAHARICSVIRKSEIKEFNNLDSLKNLNHPAELTLIKHLSFFPEILENIAITHEAHRLSFYLQELAAKFHSYWNIGKDDKSFSFLNDDKNLTEARLILLVTIKQVIKTGLNLFSIKAMERL